MKKRIIQCLLCIIIQSVCSGQAMRIGEKMPALRLGPLMNYKTETVSFSQWKGKLVILDFWGENCGSCIAGFPNLEKLQQQFKDSIQVVLVNRRDKDSVLRFFKKMKRLRIPKLPMLTGDTVLENLFPHVFMPHQVWIDGAGVVRYITDGYNATAANVRAVLNGRKVQMAEKRYDRDHSLTDPLKMLVEERWQDKLQFFSVLTHNLSGVSISNGTQRTSGKGKPNRFSFGGVSSVQLYIKAYAEGRRYNFSSSNAVQLELRDSYPYTWCRDSSQLDRWKEQYCYNYVMQVPLEEADSLYPHMRRDLQRYFKLDAFIEKRKIRCMVLTRVDSTDRLRSSGKKAVSNFWRHTEDSIKYMYNIPFGSFTIWLKNSIEYKNLATPFIDATGYTGNIDIEMNADTVTYFDIPLLRKELSRYGLLLEEREWVTDVLVIRDR